MSRADPVLRRLIDNRLMRNLQPPAVLALLYAVLIVLGALALMLPVSTTAPIRFVDAMFTATSAVTVTGLAVIDTELGLTFFGQVVVATLIQLGGLGLMTFAVLIMAVLGLPVGLGQEVYLREDLKQTSMHQLTRMSSNIFRIVLVAEVAGALLLCLSFVPTTGLWPGIWHAVFHSISAFNNAGFSTFSSGLVPYATDPIINLVIPVMFITGGIGYGVTVEIMNGRGWHHYSLHVKMMLVGTAVLIVLGVGLFALLEWNNPATLGQYQYVSERLMVSWFQGVTPRTAGFNTTDIGATHDATALMMIALMVIGGGSASTAGGLKVTTMVVLVLATIAFFRRQTQPSAFGRSIGQDQIMKVMALVAIASVLIFLGIFVVTATHDGHFLDIVFEVASAFGTTGLSRGYTPQLNDIGRWVIMFIMFLGRVGPLTLGFFLATRTTPRVRYPQGTVFLG
ncbi:MAG: Ktr system potassium transporter B [Paracoccus sp.]|nr:Ktr system potassium transporter B [Paracoccus sp. (in: a-proteobacteria)]